MRYENKVVAVTGASAGLGRAMALAFTQEGASVAVIGTDRERTESAVAMITGSGGRARPYLIDVSDETAVSGGFERIVADLGDLDVLVNNAGLAYGNIYSLMTMDFGLIERVMEVNLLGPIFCTRAATASLARRAGTVVNISSISSFMGSGAYSLSKAALNNATLAMASELGKAGIRVNAIAPGQMKSSGEPHKLPEAVRLAFKETQMIRRAGLEQDIADAALFFGSAAAGFVTGQVLTVDGGYLGNAPRLAASVVSRLLSDVS